MLAFLITGINWISWEIILAALTVRVLCSFRAPILNSGVPWGLAGIRLNTASFVLTVLVFLTFFWAISYRRFLNFTKSLTSLNLLTTLLVIVLLVFFYTNKLMVFYISFELSILPIFLIILGWGYQSERISARLRIIFYTLRASMPLLTTLILSQQRFSVTFIENFIRLNFFNKRRIAPILIIFFLLAFAVKLPIFGIHLWLPKAHVEAPVLGSMILAAILLKLGSYGLWFFFQMSFSPAIINIWISISLVGAVIVSLLCLRLRDLKIIIAYSSVSHIGILIASLRINNLTGAKGSLILIAAHGATSSAIFLIAYLMYQSNHSRSILLTKGVLGWRVSTPLIWFLVLISNMAAPPSFNLIAELLVILNLAINSLVNASLLIISVLVGTAYSLIIYRSSIQGHIILFRSSPPTVRLSTLRVFNHLYWRFLIIFALGVITV